MNHEGSPMFVFFAQTD